jgi:hypothetical protein
LKTEESWQKGRDVLKSMTVIIACKPLWLSWLHDFSKALTGQ